MKKKIEFLIIGTVIIIAIILIFKKDKIEFSVWMNNLNKAKNTTEMKQVQEVVNKIDLAKLREEYMKNSKQSFAKIDVYLANFNEPGQKGILEQNNISKVELNKEIEAIKQELLNQKLPSELKKTHLEIILSLDKLEAGINSGSIEQINEAINQLNKIKEQNQWLK